MNPGAPSTLAQVRVLWFVVGSGVTGGSTRTDRLLVLTPWTQVRAARTIEANENAVKQIPLHIIVLRHVINWTNNHAGVFTPRRANNKERGRTVQTSFIPH